MKEWYKDFIGVYENVVPKDMCNQIINKGNKLPIGKREEIYTDKLFAKDLAWNFTYDNNKDIYIYVQKLLAETIFPLYYAKYDIVKQLGLFHFPYIKFQKTLPAEGYHVWHCENDKWDVKHRLGVFSIYLNDVEEGGETEFLYQSLRIKPTQGTVCIFPAGYTHTHRGNPPLTGEKYIITGWWEFVDPKNQSKFITT